MRILEKKERALGTKLMLKADRCASGKCAHAKRPTKPGAHPRSFKKVSEYGKQLAEKQKVRFSYLLTEKQMRKYFDLANASKEPTHIALVRSLESRLDNVVFRSGLAGARRVAKQLVGHGHITVNGRKVTTPSYNVRIGDRIAFRAESADHQAIAFADNRFKNFEAPAWMKLDKEKKAVEVITEPRDVEIPFDLDLVVNYYLK